MNHNLRMYQGISDLFFACNPLCLLVLRKIRRVCEPNEFELSGRNKANHAV